MIHEYKTRLFYFTHNSKSKQRQEWAWTVTCQTLFMSANSVNPKLFNPHLQTLGNEINTKTYLWTAMKRRTWQMIPTEKIGTRKYTYSGTRYAEMTIQATSIIISHSAIARTPKECSTQQQHRLTWQQAIFEQNAMVSKFLHLFTKWWSAYEGAWRKREALGLASLLR